MEQEDDQKERTIDLTPRTPDQLYKMLHQALTGHITEAVGGDPYIPMNEDVEKLIKPYANATAIVTELKEQGELDDERARELIEQAKQR